MVAILISTEFGGVGLIRGKALINGGGGEEGYFDVDTQMCGAYLRPGAYQRTYGMQMKI